MSDSQGQPLPSKEDKRKLQQSTSEEQHAAPISPQANENGTCTNPRGETTVGPALAPSPPVTPSAHLPSRSNSGNSRRRGQPPKHNASPVMNTIESRTSSEGYGSDSHHVKPPPAHPFFSSLYDSDASDGSIVFNPNYRQAQEPSPTQQDTNAAVSRDRLASYDSLGTSGSIKYVPPRGGAASPHLSKVSEDKLEKLNPQNLPFEERRKLTELKRKRKQQQQGQKDPSPTGRLPHGLPQGYYSGVSMMSPPPPQPQPQPPHGHPYGMNPHIPMQMQLPPGAYPAPLNARLSPYRSARYDPNRPLAASGRNRQSPPQQPHLPQMPKQLPPSGMSRPMPPTLRDLRQFAGSMDSAEQDALRLRPRNRIHLPEHSITPPPPPSLPPDHVRAESTGSISSLGSQGSVFGFYTSQDDDVARYQQRVSPEYARQRQRPFERRHQQIPPSDNHHRVNSTERPRIHYRHTSGDPGEAWYDERDQRHLNLQHSSSTEFSSGDASQNSYFSSSEGSAEEQVGHNASAQNEEPSERTSLLPPPGISSSEQIEDKRNYTDNQRPSRRRRRKSRRDRPHGENRNREDEGWNIGNQPFMDEDERKRSRKKRKKKRRSRRSRAAGTGVGSPSSHASRHSSSSSSYDYRRWTRRREQMLEDERARLISQWKAEARAETMASRRKHEERHWHVRLGRYMDSEFGAFIGKVLKFFTGVEAFLCNLPLTVGAISMSIVLLGVVWFKFVEENLESCEPVHFHSSQCTFPEFPGCFYCDKTDDLYDLAVKFHFGCSAVAGVLALSFVLKILLAPQVFLDEMSSPTTASPAGLICMTMVCVFAGQGFVGQILVSLASCLHLCLVIWFIYMALAYHIMPEPSWFPNTVGIGMSAVKTWLYYPMSGHFLMAISLCLNFFFFPISLIRVALNEKISATVGYMQMSAPAISLYALTIMAQPAFEEEKPDINRFQRAHRLVYLPAMHFLFVLSVIGFLASLQSFLVRWGDFKKRNFSPAHAAFCFPTLSHANAIQAYRAAINSFSKVPLGSGLKITLYIYWVVVLAVGTILTIWITIKFFWNLPNWTNIDVEDEREPPAPYETSMILNNVIANGESLVQPFVSPAVLQANETGALVKVRGEGGRQKFVRTRKIPALGFEPTMGWDEMERERELLMEWVGKHPPRRRHNSSLSVPGIDFSNNFDDDLPNDQTGLYSVDMGPDDDLPPLGERRGRGFANPAPYQGRGYL